MPQPARSIAERTYRFASGVTLRLRSRREDVLAHFEGEYGSAAVEHSGAADIDVYAGNDAIAALGERLLDHAYEGRHKTVRWRVAVADLQQETIRVAFEGSGALVVSFLQTFYIEPLLRVKMAGRDHALVHAATLNKGDRAVLFPAGSAVGKSTMMLQHAAEGYQVQGDNYVIVTPDGRTLAFPRRLRIYSDLPKINPAVYRLLPGRERVRLRLAGLIRTLSAGYANMPRRLTVDELIGDSRICPEAHLDAVYLLFAHTGPELTGPMPRSADQAIDRIQTINEAEGARLVEALSALPGDGHEGFMEQVRSRERDVLARALNGVPAFELLVPRVRNPALLVAKIRRVTGLAAGA